MTLWERFMDWWRGEFISRPEVFRRIVAAPDACSLCGGRKWQCGCGTCPWCGAALRPRGRLGATYHYRCQQCGNDSLMQKGRGQ